MLDLVRTSLHRAITTPVGDRFFPVRVPKDLARRFNALLGDPICSREELERRRAGRAALEALKKNGGKPLEARPSAAPAVQAPVVIYLENGRGGPALSRIQEMLDAKKIAYTVLDVAEDPTTKSFVLRESKRKEDDFPVIFVASTPVGGYDELVEWDASGRLAKALAGT